MNRYRAILGATLVALLAAACGSSSPSASAEPTPTPMPSEAAPSASQGGFEPSFTEGAAAELEALIPDTVGDVTINKTSMRGDEALLSEDVDDQTRAFLEDIGVGPEDISLAIGFGFTADYSQSVTVFAFRAAGADESRLVSAWKTTMNAAGESPLEWSAANIGGKSVEASGSDPVTYLYPKGDTLFIFSASDPDLAEEIAAALP